MTSSKPDISIALFSTATGNFRAALPKSLEVSTTSASTQTIMSTATEAQPITVSVTQEPIPTIA